MQKYFSYHSLRVYFFNPKNNFARKNIKQLIPETFIQHNNPKQESLFPDIKIEIKKYTKESFENHISKLESEKAIPCSPYLGPITVENPKIASKKYRWCSCGMSFEQPFCDGYHKGTKFKPVRFVIEEACDKIELCGCKFTKNPPFCDKSTCNELKNSKENKSNQKNENEDKIK